MSHGRRFLPLSSSMGPPLIAVTGNATVVSPGGGSSPNMRLIVPIGRGISRTSSYPDSDWDAPRAPDDSPPDSDDSEADYRRTSLSADFRLRHPGTPVYPTPSPARQQAPAPMHQTGSGRLGVEGEGSPIRRPHSTPPIDRIPSQPSPTAQTSTRQPLPACVVCGVRPQRMRGSKFLMTCEDPRCAVELDKIQNGKAFGTAEKAKAEDNMCVVCHVRPKYSNGRGKSYPTCGLTCAAKLNPTPRGGKKTDDDSLCDFCHARPKFFDANKNILYPQCGRGCRDRARAARAGTRYPPATGGGQNTSPAHVLGDDNSCLNCWIQPRRGEFHFCSESCANVVKDLAPTLLEAPRGHTTFRSVANTFTTAWQSKKRPCPTVKKVYKVIQRDSYKLQYTQYKNRVDNSSEVEAWFTPTRSCAVGNGGITQLCPVRSACQLCSCLNTVLNAQEFAKGIPVSMTTNQADRFSLISNRAPYKTMLLVKVAAGKSQYIPKGPAPGRRPAGYDSVVVTSTGNSIEGMTVYDGEAVQPAYLVIYE